MNLVPKEATKRMEALVSVTFLPIHVAMLALFAYCGVTPMVWFNVGSVLYYLFSFYLIHRGAFRTYVLLTYIEVVAHMTAAVVCTGWETGFQVPLVGISILAFLMEYLGRSLHMDYVSGLGLGLLSTGAYLASYIYEYYHPALYPLPPHVVFWVQIFWGVNALGLILTFLQAFVFVTIRSEEKMSDQLSHDELTGLPNRYHIADYLRRAEGEEGLEGMWLAMLDIDDFKLINDTYGHNCGDYVLKTLGEILRGSKVGAEPCRWGGEEFLLVGEMSGDLSDELERLERLRRTISGYAFWYKERRLSITVTMGVATYEPGMSVDEWVNAADRKLYEGKVSGKNKLVA